MQRASEEFSEAQQVEQSAKAARDDSLQKVREAKDKRTADFKRAKAGQKGAVQDVRADDSAIRKAERALEITTAKWQRAKDATVLKGHAITPAVAAVENMQVARVSAEDSLNEIRLSKQRVSKAIQQEKADYKHAKSKYQRLLEARAATVSEFKRVHRKRVHAKKTSSSKEMKKVRAQEQELLREVREATDEAWKFRARLVAEKLAQSHRVKAHTKHASKVAAKSKKAPQ